MKKKNVALVFGITENYVFALANTLIGLIENNDKFWDDIIVYCDKISVENKKYLNKIVKCEFIEASQLSFASGLSREAIEKYSVACFYRYECFNLLDKYKVVIWNDVDILIQGDISGLLNYAKNGIALTKNIANFKVEANFSKLILEYDMFTQLYNSGIMVLRDTLPNYNLICNWCINKTSELVKYLRWPDQGILNIMLQEFKISPDLIDINMYCCHPSSLDYIESAKIIHAYGDEKFWNSNKLIKKFPKWKEYNERWEIISKTTTQPLVSCIMSTYNRYDYLKESVRSILDQTYSNFELIVVTEKCENQSKICQILKDFKDDRIKIVKNSEKLGFAESLNVGLSLAKGKYIARMDDDDISLPDRFSKQVDFMEKNSHIGICGTKAKFFGNADSEISVETDYEILKINTLFRTPFVHPTVMMRKELLDKFNLKYDKDYFTEDYEFWSRAVYCFPCTNLDEILLMYRVNDSQLTSGSNEEKIHNSHKKIMRNQFENHLHLIPTENELELIQGRFNALENCYNFNEAFQLKKDFIKKIIANNQKYKIFNQNKLLDVFCYPVDNQIRIKVRFKQFVKKVIKKIIYPFYNRLMIRIDHKIKLSEQKSQRYCDRKFEELKDSL